MAGRALTMVRFEEIRRRLAQGRSDREIAGSLKCSRKTVRAIREGGTGRGAELARGVPDPMWMGSLDWTGIKKDLSLGHPLKFIWEERAKLLTGYPNFWKQFYRKFPHLREATVTLREFAPGERIEVDWAGDKIEWLDMKTGEVHEVPVFLGALGFSQLVFAYAPEDMKSRNWLSCHRRMFEAFGGVTQVLVPDCLKTGVLICHLYDPDLNPSYSELASHYKTSIVPARASHPKDKAIIEGLVKILMRYFKWCYRMHTFTSLAEINHALADTADKINRKPHTRFKVSRLERFEKMERSLLKPLPETSFEVLEWKKAKLHPDCFISVEGAYYSAPHIHRGKDLRVKLTESHVEIFLNLERLAIHPRDRHRCGNRVRNIDHLPENSKAYFEATPQNLLSQARFISGDLHGLVVQLFNEDTLGNIRRVQGLIGVCSKEIHKTSHEAALPRIEQAIKSMQHFNRIRVSYFQELLGFLRKQNLKPDQAREITRLPNNPMIRHRQKDLGDGELSKTQSQERQESLRL